MAQGDVSIGVAGTLGPEAVAALAPAIEQAGFRSLWVNDTPGGDSIAALEAAADATSGLVLATGVLPVDRRDADSIVTAVQRAQLPEHRVVLGIGSGATRAGALSLVSDAVDTLHEGLDARVLVGALGPKMRALGAREADGVLLSWLTPEIATGQAQEAHARASDSRVALYVRTAVTDAASTRLAEEAERYTYFEVQPSVEVISAEGLNNIKFANGPDTDLAIPAPFGTLSALALTPTITAPSAELPRPAGKFVTSPGARNGIATGPPAAVHRNA